ncbi:hypothetical protein PHJA_002101900 [Phtheirospermum japonicum]|uniref:Uncharacterized protein n=1 Tax=Phtheirospermum japonicum TaxID=374723 RepID=A0A830CPW4_9LAMI|nr:hypothetical protein PHJA_002101900 [Phtheirospermum japonicum]
MEPGPTMVAKMKGFAKSTQDKAQVLLNWFQKSNHHSPIEILKRLQREAFSDIMKLRDRQEKVERLLTYKSFKGSPFQEASTRVKGKVDILGALFFMDGVDEQKYEAIQRSGIRTGIDARLAFETGVREKDTLMAEFITSEKGPGGDMSGGPLSLAKVFYKAHVNDWFSAIAVPIGAQCRDVGVPSSSHQETSLSDYAEFGPPLLNQQNGSAIGIIARKSNVVASLAQFVSGVGTQANSCRVARTLSTFGQVVWQLTGNTKLSLLGVHTASRPSGPNVSLGAFALPVSLFKRNRFSDTYVEEDERRNLGGSLALMLNTELEEGTRIGGWIETRNSDPRQLQWAVTMCDAPEDEFGWGLSLGGLLQGPKSLEHFQVETYLNLNVGKRFKLQPAVVYVKDGSTQFPALMLRSSWSL